jgi:hypothetical protein
VEVTLQDASWIVVGVMLYAEGVRRGQSFKSSDWKKKAANCRGELNQVRVLAASWPLKSNSPMERYRLVNLLALRLQWSESTPTQASPRAKK